jgi:hypothetical protein
MSAAARAKQGGSFFILTSKGARETLKGAVAGYGHRPHESGGDARKVTTGITVSSTRFPAPLKRRAAAVAGGLVGTELGRRRLATVTLRRVLSAVLVIAGLKMMLT